MKNRLKNLSPLLMALLVALAIRPAGVLAQGSVFQPEAPVVLSQLDLGHSARSHLGSPLATPSFAVYQTVQKEITNPDVLTPCFSKGKVEEKSRTALTASVRVVGFLSFQSPVLRI